MLASHPSKNKLAGRDEGLSLPFPCEPQSLRRWGAEGRVGPAEHVHAAGTRGGSASCTGVLQKQAPEQRKALLRCKKKP